jgi:predicted nuclease of predicted toxin-antitoxin system
MKILLDECVPWPMRKFLTGHECSTAQQRGWGGIRNGDLLRQAEGEFDLFITSDQNIRYQQNLAGRLIAILELSTNDLRRIQAAEALIQTAIETIQPREFRRLGIPF